MFFMTALLHFLQRRNPYEDLNTYFQTSKLHQFLLELISVYEIEESVAEFFDKKKYQCYLKNNYAKIILDEPDVIDILDTIFYDCPQLCLNLKKEYLKQKAKIAKALVGKENKCVICPCKSILDLIEYCTRDKLLVIIGHSAIFIKKVMCKFEKEYSNAITDKNKIKALKKMKTFVQEGMLFLREGIVYHKCALDEKEFHEYNKDVMSIILE